MHSNSRSSHVIGEVNLQVKLNEVCYFSGAQGVLKSLWEEDMVVRIFNLTIRLHMLAFTFK